MSSPLDAAGYEALRSYVQTEWPYVALIQSDGTEATRIDVVNDSRASWTSGSSSTPVEATIQVQGSNSDIPNPVTIIRTESYSTATSTTRRGADSVKDVEIQTDEDEVTFVHRLAIPP